MQIRTNTATIFVSFVMIFVPLFFLASTADIGFAATVDKNNKSSKTSIPLKESEPNNDSRKGANIELIFDKQEYFLGENILLHYHVINQGNEPFTISTGGDYRGAPRALRFKVIATDTNDNQVDDPYPSTMCMGGLGGESTLQPGQSFWVTLPLMRYCNFENSGTYKVKVYHDLGWDKGDYYRLIEKNSLPEGIHIAPIVENSIKLVMPNPEQARQVLNNMLNLPSDPMTTFREKSREYMDFTAVRYPIYLPILLDLVNKGDLHGLEGIGVMATPGATQALIKLSDSQVENISTKALELLLQRLPIPKSQEGIFWNKTAREHLVQKSWREDMKANVMSKSWKLLKQNNKESLIKGATIIKCLGSKEDLAKFEKFIDQGLNAMKDDLKEQGSYPRPISASDSLTDAGRELIKLGAEVSTNTQTPGRAVLFMLALGDNNDFRPANWQEKASDLLKHPIPFVRAITLQNLPKEFPSDKFDIVSNLIEDKYVYVQYSACQFAEKTLSPRFQASLLKELKITADEWLLSEAFNTALSCGVNRDKVMEVCVERLDNSDLSQKILNLLNEIVDRKGGYGYSQVDWSNVNQIKAEWRKFIENNRDRICSGPKFKVAEPPLTKALYPRGFSFYPTNEPAWPQW
jgi:hypothetical protein